LQCFVYFLAFKGILNLTFRIWRFLKFVESSIDSNLFNFIQIFVHFIQISVQNIGIFFKKINDFLSLPQQTLSMVPPGA
jgi:hypothetical protein